MEYFDSRRFRNDHGKMSQTKFAEMIGVTQSFVAQAEKGERKYNDEMKDKLRSHFDDVDSYITELSGLTMVQNNNHGDNINGDKIVSEDTDIELVKLRAELDAKNSEIKWLRELVEKLTSKG